MARNTAAVSANAARCTVIVGDKPVFSCLMPVAAVGERAVRTIEGLGTAGHPGPLQQAFIDRQAAQCGYCIAGMVMRAQALLERTPSPTDDQILTHMQPNCAAAARICASSRRSAKPVTSTARPACEPPPPPKTRSSRRRTPALHHGRCGRGQLHVDAGRPGARADHHHRGRHLHRERADAARRSQDRADARRVDPRRRARSDHGLHRQGRTRHRDPDRLHPDRRRTARCRHGTDHADDRRHRHDARTKATRRAVIRVADSGTAIFNAAAQVRGLLVEAAASKLGVDASTLTVQDGTIVAADGRRLSYGDAVSGTNLHREAQPVSPLIAPRDFRTIGQSMQRIDIPARSRAAESYVQDMRLPGMLHARAVRPPMYGATLASVDLERVRSMPGVGPGGARRQLSRGGRRRRMACHSRDARTVRGGEMERRPRVARAAHDS